MANKKISELSIAATLTGSEVLPIVQSGQTVQTTAQSIANLGGGLSGTQYVYVSANGTDVENAAELQAAYNTAKTMSPSATNRITIIAAPGKYNFNLGGFNLDTEYIDLVSLDGNRSIIFNGIGTIFILANHVYVKGIDTLSLPFQVGGAINFGSLPNLKLENCKGGNQSLGLNAGFVLSGTFINCEMGDQSFGATSNTTLSGTFINCIAGNNSFGEAFSSVSGIFTNCTAGDSSFGSQGTASGTFTNCVAGAFSYGGDLSGNLSGRLFYCRLTNNASFKTVSLGGYTIYCIDGKNIPDNQGFLVQNKL